MLYFRLRGYTCADRSPQTYVERWNCHLAKKGEVATGHRQCGQNVRMGTVHDVSCIMFYQIASLLRKPPAGLGSV